MQHKLQAQVNRWRAGLCDGRAGLMSVSSTLMDNHICLRFSAEPDVKKCITFLSELSILFRLWDPTGVLLDASRCQSNPKGCETANQRLLCVRITLLKESPWEDVFGKPCRTVLEKRELFCLPVEQRDVTQPNERIDKVYSCTRSRGKQLKRRYKRDF